MNTIESFGIRILLSLSFFFPSCTQATYRKLPSMLGIIAARHFSCVSFTQNKSQNPTLEQQSSKSPEITGDLCHYVLRMSKLPVDSTKPPVPYTFTTLGTFFQKSGVKDYADAAKFGRENTTFDNPDEFNTTMGTLFKKNDTDIVPVDSKKYQAIIFATSGIDVFVERLAFLSRLAKFHNIQTGDIIALVGTHAHRKDLQTSAYLINLPRLFSSDFDLARFDKDEVQQTLAPFVAQKDWTHRDGMEVAWQLVTCDKTMNHLRSKFRYFSGNGDPTLRTEQLIEQLLAGGIRWPLSKENPIAFIVNSQGAAKTKEMIKKCFADSDAVDLLIARSAAEEIEGVLYNDTPQQRAMTKLFHFYRILETLAATEKQ